ncbi:DNA-binding protein [Coprothermobacteraceae bacterium]|nr:DNA-binding protein [Coprothermobacteraceae bacterium]
MTDRQKKILSALVEYCLNNGYAPSSSVLCQVLGERWSSATIRNELAELRKQGYLTQDSKVSVNEPTDEAIAFYFGVKLTEAVLTDMGEHELSVPVRLENTSVEELLDSIAYDISSLIGSPSVGVMVSGSRIAGVSLVPLSKNKIAVVVVLDSGVVRSSIVALERDITEGEIQLLNSLIEEQMRNRPLVSAATVARDLDIVKRRYAVILDTIVKVTESHRRALKIYYHLGKDPNPDTVREMNSFVKAAEEDYSRLKNRITWRVDLGILLDGLYAYRSAGVFADVSSSKISGFLGAFVRVGDDMDRALRILKGVKEVARKEIQKICE